MKKIIIFIFLLSQIKGLQFQLKYFLNDGILWDRGTILIGDTDRDSLFELIFRQHPGGGNSLVAYEQTHPDSLNFILSCIIMPPYNPDTFPYSPSPWILGDFDQDGLYDMICQDGWTGSQPPAVSGISVYEQPDSFSYPTEEVWRDTTYSGLQAVISSGDVDGDSIPEILKSDGYATLIFETRGNNLFERTYEAWSANHDIGSISTSSPSDFDKDGKNEFIIGGLEWAFVVYEAAGNDSFQFIWKSPYIPTTNLYDLKSLPDLDHDGFPEFMVKGYTSDGKTTVLIYEAIGDNNYEIIWDTVYLNYHWQAGLSDIGDVDMDGEPELVLELPDGFRVLKSIGNNKFVDIGGNPWVSGGISHIKVAPDIDRNGINEIVISGYGKTYFFEAVLNVEEKPVLKFSDSELKIPTFFDKIKLKDYEIFNISGRKIKDISEGIYFIKLKNTKKFFKIIKIK